jgi:hypothetical protein
VRENDESGGGQEAGRPRRFHGDPNGSHDDEGEVRELTPEELAALAEAEGDGPKVPAEPDETEAEREREHDGE